jgi:importin-5
MLLSCGKTSNTLTTLMLSASFYQLINCIGSKTNPSFLAPLFECFSDSLKVVGGHSALALEFQTGVTDVMKQEVQTLVDKRKNRSQHPSSELADNKIDGGLVMCRVRLGLKARAWAGLEWAQAC